MTKDQLNYMNRGKAWCFDNHITEEQVEAAWNRAKESGSIVVRNLAKHGNTWWCLAPHMLQRLMERYGNDAEDDK